MKYQSLSPLKRKKADQKRVSIGKTKKNISQIDNTFSQEKSDHVDISNEPKSACIPHKSHALNNKDSQMIVKTKKSSQMQEYGQGTFAVKPISSRTNNHLPAFEVN